MTKEFAIQSIKITIGVVIAVTLAKLLNMQFYTSVSTIVIVSMLSAKKQSIGLAGTRILAAIVSLLLATILFSILGFSFPVFMLYILIFTFLMYKFDMKVAIVLNVVLIMHIQSLGQITIPILFNEFGLMLLGILVALITNFFIVNIEDELISYQMEVDVLFNSVFKNMGRCLNHQCTADVVEAELSELDRILTRSEERASQYMNNYYIRNNNYYDAYFRMRRRQYYIVKRMQKFLQLKFLQQKEVELLKNFTDDFVNNTKILDTCETQLKIIGEIKHHFTYEASLPASHDKLQKRIALHQYLYSLEDLVSVKMRFINKFERVENSQ